MDEIRKRVPDTELLAQLAEECMELGQAALKMRRVLDGTNPTPKTLEACKVNLTEEWADVVVCVDALAADWIDRVEAVEIAYRKTKRWLERLEVMEELG